MTRRKMKRIYCILASGKWPAAAVEPEDEELNIFLVFKDWGLTLDSNLFPIRFVLKHGREPGEKPAFNFVPVYEDFILVAAHGNIFSQCARDIIDSFRTEEDRIEWYPAIVRHPLTGEERPYWFLYFLEPLGYEVLDWEETVWVDDESWGRYPAYPAIDLNKLGNHNVFTVRRTSCVLVTRDIVERLQAAGCASGMKFVLTRQRTETGRCVGRH